MKGKIFLLAIIAVLVLLNAGTLTFMWLNRPDSPRHRKVVDPTLFMAKKLELNERQRATFRHLRIRYRERMDRLERLDRDLHHRFFDLAQLKSPDTTRSKQVADSIAETRREMELLTLEHFTTLRQQLDERQKRRFDTVFYDALKVVLPPPPPPPPPPMPPTPQPEKEQ